MPLVDALLHARWVAPVRPAGVVFDNYCLVIHHGRILDLLPSEQAKTRYQSANVFSGPSHLLIPGLINTHTHAAMTLLRGLADDLPLMTWLRDHIWPAEARWVSPEFVTDGTLLAAAEMLRGGITCFNDMYFFPDEAAKAAEQVGIRACVGLIVLDFPTAWAADGPGYLALARAVHDRWQGHPRVYPILAPHAPYTVSDHSLQQTRDLAEALNLPIHIHVHESAHEVEEALASSGERPLARLDRLGLLSPRLLAVHMTQLLDEEISRCAERGVHVIHCPESNLKLASGFCPTAKLLAAGVNVALGTDGAASNNDLDLLGELRSAALLAKAVAGDAAAFPAHQALHAATLAGAKALGLEQELGSLEIGKAADMVALDLSDLAHQPVYHPLSQLVYSASRHAVSDVWVAGQPVVRQGRLTRLDPAQLLDKARWWAQRIGAADTQ